MYSTFFYSLGRLVVLYISILAHEKMRSQNSVTVQSSIAMLFPLNNLILIYFSTWQFNDINIT